ncbi:MAG: ATP-binding protein, partial [Burkholderiales bacterium]
MQWADLPSLLLLQFFARALRDSRILLVGAYRDAEVSHIPELASLLGTVVREGHHVPLRGLSEEEVRCLIEQVTGSAVSSAFARTVYQKTEGNPFFVDEVVRVVAAEGALEPSAYLPPWSFPLPQGVREAVRRRLAPLPGTCTAMLTVASVIGREFDLVGLQRACQMPLARLLQVLGPALTSRIIVPSAGATGCYRFSHVLIRETLYEGMDPADRMSLHGQIGQVLETLYQANPEPYLSELAHHFLQAAPEGEAEKGVGYAIRAGKRAAASLAHEEAAELYQRALQVLDPRSPAEERRRCDLLFSLGEAQWRTGDWAGARETFRQAGDIARRTGDATLLARSALGFGGEGSPSFWVASNAMDHTLVTLLEEALATLGEQASGLRARLLARLSIDLYFSPAREQGVQLSQQAVALARQLGDPQVLAIALRARCIALWRPESADERLAVAAEMVNLTGVTDDRELTLPARRFLITGFLERGDLAATDREIDAWAQIAGALRQPLYLAFLGGWRAMRAILDGQFAEGER